MDPTVPDRVSEKLSATTPVDGWTLWRWPIFQELLDRLGVPSELRTKGLTIRVYEGEMVSVTHEYLASVAKPDKVETTAMRNEAFRTFAPPAGFDADRPVIAVTANPNPPPGDLIAVSTRVVEITPPAEWSDNPVVHEDPR